MARIDQQRAARELDPFLQTSLLARQHREMIEGVGIGRLAAQDLVVAARGLGERALSVEQRGLLQ